VGVISVDIHVEALEIGRPGKPSFLYLFVRQNAAQTQEQSVGPSLLARWLSQDGPLCAIRDSGRDSINVPARGPIGCLGPSRRQGPFRRSSPAVAASAHTIERLQAMALQPGDQRGRRPSWRVSPHVTPNPRFFISKRCPDYNCAESQTPPPKPAIVELGLRTSSEGPGRHTSLFR
jgi:hypothetical protein